MKIEHMYDGIKYIGAAGETIKKVKISCWPIALNNKFTGEHAMDPQEIMDCHIYWVKESELKRAFYSLQTESLVSGFKRLADAMDPTNMIINRKSKEAIAKSVDELQKELKDWVVVQVESGKSTHCLDKLHTDQSVTSTRRNIEEQLGLKAVKGSVETYGGVPKDLVQWKSQLCSILMAVADSGINLKVKYRGETWTLTPVSAIKWVSKPTEDYSHEGWCSHESNS